MSLFSKKRKAKLFGANIPQNCIYCLHNSGKDQDTVCSVAQTMKDGKCKKYTYNPLMREPRKQAGLKREQYKSEDFSL